MAKMMLKDGFVWVAEAPLELAEKMKQSGLMRVEKKTKYLYGTASLRLLDELKKSLGLPKPIDEIRLKMRENMGEIDAERIRESPSEMVRYPVKKKLFEHQIRGANMAILAFGWEEK